MSEQAPGPPIRLLAQMRQDLLDGVPRYQRRRRRRAVVSVGAALLLFMVGVGALASSLGGNDESRIIMVEPTPSSTTVVPGSTTTSTDLKAGDFPASVTTDVVATDDGLLLMDFRNQGGDVRIGRWDTDTGRTEALAPTGLVWRAFPAVAWTGDELLVAGGSNGPGLDQAVVAYDPATQQWRQLADPPGYQRGTSTGAGGAPGFWTGTELLVPSAGAALDPGSDTWRPMAPSPLSPRVGGAQVWTGEVLFDWGGVSRQRRRASVRRVQHRSPGRRSGLRRGNGHLVDGCAVPARPGSPPRGWLDRQRGHRGCDPTRTQLERA